MDDNISQENNPWISLSTVTNFDTGNDTWTTRRMDDNVEVKTSGQVVGRVLPSTSLLIESLIQQLCTMFEGDVVRRNKLYFAICDKLHEMKLIDSSYNMREFEMIRGQYQRALYHLVTVARASTGSESALQVPSCLIAEWSRYRREFQEINFIAAGGFGNVFKALHRLDGIEYAIKKITVRSGRVKTIMQHLQEVKTLAKLNHVNIVSYKGAWIEPALPSIFIPSIPNMDREHTNAQISEKITETGSQRVYPSKDVESNYKSNRKNTRTSSSITRQSYNGSNRSNKSFSSKKVTYRTGRRIVESNSSDVVDTFNTSNVVEDSCSDVVSFRNENEESKSQIDTDDDDDDDDDDASESYETEDTEESESFDESVDDRRICRYNSSVTNQYATLYIQMALCEKTLRQWLDEREDTTPQSVITTIITQIVCGIDYIHSCNIVHHDIKPSNIFISTSGRLQVQLGDFGLACPLQREGHHSVVGTHMYAAPEQLHGKCNPKSDIYSLGIIILELLVPMKTSMERSQIISALKTGQIPTTVTANYQKLAHVVSQLVQKDPNRRPSTKQLLQDLSEDKDFTIARLKNDNDKKNNMIEELQNKVAQLEAEIAKLKIPLESTNCN